LKLQKSLACRLVQAEEQKTVIAELPRGNMRISSNILVDSKNIFVINVL
jgi:hypothetical protein